MQAVEAIAIRLGVDMKLFDTAASASRNGGEVRIEDLASEANADPVLVSRCSQEYVHLNHF